MRMFLLDSSYSSFATLAAFVVCRRSQFVFYHRINQNQAVTFRLEWEILIFQRTAIQANQTTGFSEYGSKLIHNTAVHTTIIVFGSLAYFCQFEFIYFIITEQFVQCESISTFQCGGWRHTGSQWHIACKSCIESFYIDTTFDHLAAYTENVSGPAGTGSVFFVQSEFCIVFQVDWVSAYFICSVRFDFCNHSFIDSPWKYESTVIVGMFADKVDAARWGINKSCSSVKVFDETTSYVFYIHDTFKLLRVNKLFDRNILVYIFATDQCII